MVVNNLHIIVYFYMNKGLSQRSGYYYERF